MGGGGARAGWGCGGVRVGQAGVRHSHMGADQKWVRAVKAGKRSAKMGCARETCREDEGAGGEVRVGQGCCPSEAR